MAEDEKLLSISEAARRLQISPSLLRKWADRGEIKTVKLPGSGYRRFSPSDVEQKRREMGLA
ncbi:MAG TPA: helix-turn-helix domain-containing protein [Chloroflexota bacterium]|nr:helix-turn-helix domain-containing protein [Chloroflexota bacterium]